IQYDAQHHLYFTELGTKWANDPVAGIVTKFPSQVLAFWAGVWVAILAFTILVIATNAGLIGISRLSYSLAIYKLVPVQFSNLHPRFKTPYISIVVFAVAAAVLVLPGKLDLLAATYSLAATFAFCTAHLAVMRLRYVSPDLYRPYQMPLNIPFGRAAIPVLSVVAGAQEAPPAAARRGACRAAPGHAGAGRLLGRERARGLPRPLALRPLRAPARLVAWRAGGHLPLRPAAGPQPLRGVAGRGL